MAQWGVPRRLSISARSAATSSVPDAHTEEESCSGRTGKVGRSKGRHEARSKLRQRPQEQIAQQGAKARGRSLVPKLEAKANALPGRVAGSWV